MSQNIFSLEGVISWLEMQPGETEYDYLDYGDCLLAQYCRVRGSAYKTVSIGSGPTKNPKVLLERVAAREPWTYSAALTRARELVG